MTNEDKIPGKDGWTGTRPKRFYKDVTVADADGGYGVLLDGRPIKTPLKQTFAVPTEDLAKAVAGEWQAQDEHVVAASMPLLRLANTAIDQAEDKLGAIVEEFTSYAGSDLLCYRADTPDGLVARQETHWDPLLTWAARELGAGFVVTQGIIHQSQPDAVLSAVAAWAGRRDRFAMTALQGLTALTGSAVIAMALGDDARLGRGGLECRQCGRRLADRTLGPGRGGREGARGPPWRVRGGGAVPEFARQVTALGEISDETLKSPSKPFDQFPFCGYASSNWGS